MPDDVKTAVDAQLPDDKIAEDGKTTTPGELKNPKDVEDKTNDGVWKFEGFKDQDTTTDEVDAKVNGADVTFEGKWKFTPNEHKVTYEYVSGTEGKELPEALKSKAPEAVTGKVKGDKVTSPVPTGDDATFRDEANKGTWKFKSYDKNEVEISNKDEKVTGTWEFTPDPEPETHNVIHKFVSNNPKKELPQAVKDLTPDQQTGKKDGETVTPTAPTQTTVKDTENDGTWTFEGYKDQNPDTDEVDAKVNGADVTFEGEWKFTPNKHNVTYEYVSGTEGKELPEALKNKAPEAVTGKVKGEKVTSPVPTGDDATFRDDVNKGTWKFKSYDKNEVEISNKNETVKGTWEFTPDPEQEKYNVTHKFVSKDPNKELPKAVKDLTPDQQTGKKDGETVTPTAPTQTTVKDTENDGTWTFEGYKDQNPDTEAVDAKVDGADVTFEGAWKFTPNKHNVSYKFVSEDPTKPLPKEVTDLLPTPEKDKVKGDKVTPTKPIPTSITTKDGVWTFVKYDKDSETVGNKDVEFTGTWKFSPKPDPVTYNVNHQFKSATEGKELPQAVKDQLPAQQTGKKDGDVVSPTAPKQTAVEDTDNDGAWNFKGYKDLDTTTNEVDAKVDGADVMFEGSWEFTPNKHNVTHKFVSKDPNKELPKEVLDLLPANQTGKVKGDEVKPTEPQPKTVKVKDGTWKFVSYDKAKETVEDKDVEFKGTWEFTPDSEPEKYNVTHKFVSKDSNKELPKEVLDLLPANQTGKVKGDVVNPTEPKTTTVNVEDGTWKFVSYDKDQETIDNKDVEFTGTWEFTPKTTPTDYNVNHKFVSATEGKELPKAVTDLIPDQQTGKKDGETVTPTAPTQKEVVDTENDGTWTFEGYDENSKTIDKSDITFEAKWKFTPNEHKVTYEYVSGTDGKELPAELKAKAPKDATGKVKGDKVTSPIPTDDDATFRDDANKGTWTFKSYDKDSVEITNKDENVKGTWVFTPDAELVTEYVDEDGNTIAPRENGTKDKKDIDGYEFVRTETDEQGNTKHIYKKIVTPPTDVVTEYVDEDGKTIAPKENGTKDKKDIDGYEFVRTEKDDKGNTKHIYKKIVTPPADVVTEYVDEDGNTIAPKENGTKDKKDIDGYEFVRTEKDDKGNTKHIYKKKTTPPTEVVTEYVDEDGKTIAPKENGKQPNKDIEGYEFVRTETDDKGNTKHIYKKKTTPPTTEVVTKFVDENGNPLALEEKGKQDKKDIPAYEYVKTYTDNDGNTVHVYRLKQNPTPSAETRYVDENGNQLLPPKEGTKDPENIDGYTIINTRTDENGNTIHTYSKNPTEGVETRFVDTEGNQILADKSGTHGPSLINGYEFVRTEKDEQGNTTHIYRKLPTPSKEVVTKFLDENGNELASPLKGRNPSKEIPGYEILRTETDSDGNIIYVYRKKASESQKVTKYVDENGNEISKSTKGDNPMKDIDGYEFVKTETDKDGNTVHIYKRKTTPPTTDVVTEYVDENGNTIAPKEKGTKDKKDIEGYEFVETKTDEQGNTKHIYKKVTPPADVVTEYVDEKGNTIAPKENGTKANKDIKGYEFVKTETDDKGNTKHIYKKKTTSTTAGDNPKTGITGLNDFVILSLIGSIIGLYKIRKYKRDNI